MQAQGTILFVAPLLLTLAAAPASHAQPPSAVAPSAADSTRGVLAIRAATALEDLYFNARWRSEIIVDGAWPEPVGAVWSMASHLSAKFGSPLAWGALDALAAGCESGVELAERWAALPETLALPGGRSVELRGPALTFAQALEAAEPAYRNMHILSRFDEPAARVTNGFSGPLQSALSEACSVLELPVPASVQVLLVSQAPRPGAMTLRTAQGPICVVGVAGFEGTLLEEAVLHEAIHAADAAATGGVLAELRAKLELAGIAKTDPRYRDAVHTIFFVQAAETIRHLADPAHVDYGDARGYYERVGPLAGTVRAAWTSHVRGEITKDEALERIVAAATGS